MPSRFWSFVILVYWSIATFWLFRQDVLPTWSLGYPPDLRGIVLAANSDRPTRWSIQLVDNPKDPDARRAVGEVRTASSPDSRGGYELTAHVDFDAAAVLRGTTLGTQSSLRLLMDSSYHVDPSGNLVNLQLLVYTQAPEDPLIVVKGERQGSIMRVESQGPLPVLNQKRAFDYESGSVVRDGLRPLDRLPGLQVGQHWETRMINPFTGQIDRSQVEVTGRGVIHWNGDAVTAFEVAERVGPILARTWVRSDGMILRQEVPFPFARVVLEREPETGDGPYREKAGP